ncbi:MAG: LUD domain-containing protein [Halioglobus sp.]
MSDARSEILARVRHASRCLPEEEITLALSRLGNGPSATLPHPDMAISFLTNVLKNQGTIAIASNRSEAVTVIGKYLYEHHRSRKLVAGNDARLAALPWRDAGLLPRFGEAESGELAALSYAVAGIAETGSIVTCTGRNNPAANNLLTEDHIVIVALDDLVERYDTALEVLQTARPRGVNIISGPSGTADIAMHMVHGAHGPRRWHVVLLGDVPADYVDQARDLAGLSGKSQAEQLPDTGE